MTQLKRWKSRLLTIENAKTVKGEKLGYLTGILYLAPAFESVPFGGKDLCPFASKGCAAACLFTAGRGRFKEIREARIAKTLYYFKHRREFMEDLVLSIARVVRKAKRLGYLPVVRLNGTSDIAWESIKHEGRTIFEHFPNVQFMDYSKIPARAKRFHAGNLPPNYHLTFSRSESNAETVADIVANTKTNVAVVFDSKTLPATYLGREVINGDEHDLRFTDKQGVIVGLSAKGKAKKDGSGFVVTVGG